MLFIKNSSCKKKKTINKHSVSEGTVKQENKIKHHMWESDREEVNTQEVATDVF